MRYLCVIVSQIPRDEQRDTINIDTECTCTDPTFHWLWHVLIPLFIGYDIAYLLALPQARSVSIKAASLSNSFIFEMSCSDRMISASLLKKPQIEPWIAVFQHWNGQREWINYDSIFCRKRSATKINSASFFLCTRAPPPAQAFQFCIRLASKEHLATLSFPKRHKSLLKGQKTILKFETWLQDRNRSQEDEVDTCL